MLLSLYEQPLEDIQGCLGLCPTSLHILCGHSFLEAPYGRVLYEVSVPQGLIQGEGLMVMVMVKL